MLFTCGIRTPLNRQSTRRVFGLLDGHAEALVAQAVG